MNWEPQLCVQYKSLTMVQVIDRSQLEGCIQRLFSHMNFKKCCENPKCFFLSHWTLEDIAYFRFLLYSILLSWEVWPGKAMRQNAGQSLVDCELTRQLPVLFSHRKNQTSRGLRTIFGRVKSDISVFDICVLWRVMPWKVHCCIGCVIMA